MMTATAIRFPLPSLRMAREGSTAPLAFAEIQRSTAVAGCSHLSQIKDVSPHTKGCEECLATGGRWVHLRLCLSCGHVGCCDSSVGRHARKHSHDTHHAIVQSFEPGEDWRWCFVDEIEV
jgi:uncharacterized UBP type Zn finger protein